MKKILIIAFISTFAMSCSRVPITNRKQVHLLPESEIVSMSLTQYHDFITQNTVLKTGTNVQMVNDVSSKITKAVEEVLKHEGLAERIAEFHWEVNLIESPEINAWCMPGGKIVVYSGILPITQDANGLAVVLSHEISHAVAQHGNERMSQQLATYTGLTALNVALSTKPSETNDLLMAAIGAGAEVGILLPFSRTQESEADRLGLIFMAAAGYDPHTAIGFWQRMSASNKGPNPPEFLSTHPSDQTRISDIQNKYMVEAMKYYKPQ